jgi:carbon monoxide dehydrogenase subunit G
MPGAQRLGRVSEDRYEGLMRVGIGPISAAEFSLAVGIHGRRPAESYAMRVDARGALGFVAGTASVSLASGGDGTTAMRYRAELRVGGTIAAVGQRLMDSVSRIMSQQGLKALNRELVARLQRDSGIAR